VTSPPWRPGVTFSAPSGGWTGSIRRASRSRRIRLAVGAKVEATIEDGPAHRSQAGFYLRPGTRLAIRLFWESADALWRWAGDTATDENHYSKRAILSVILATTIAVRMNSGEEAAREHLAARIDASWRSRMEGAAEAGRLRARPRRRAGPSALPLARASAQRGRWPAGAEAAARRPPQSASLTAPPLRRGAQSLSGLSRVTWPILRPGRASPLP
jgi:hypothetical protein